MRKTVILSLCMAMSMTLSAQNKGGISTDMLQRIQQAQPSSVAEKALANAIASNSIDDLAKNNRALVGIDDHFSVMTLSQNIHNQKSSGRCWMFSGLNVLRGNFAQSHKGEQTVEFSHAYLFFWDQLEKANLMLQGVIDCANKPIEDPQVQFFFRHPVSDGGTFCGVADLVDKYGLVPMSVMPESYSANNTSRMDRLVSSKLREFGLELRKMVAAKKKPAAILQRKTEMLGTIYRMLSLALGEPVKEFTYTFRDKKGNPVGETRRFTPKEFYNVTVGQPLNGSFIMVMNDPRRPYYKTYEVDLDRHVYDGHNWKYLNLPMEEIAKLAIASLKDGRKLYSSYDVGKQADRKSGYSTLDNYDYATLFGTTFGMTKAERIETFDSGSTHAMTLSAVDLDSAGKPVKWMVENSWGADSGHKGCVIMTNDWFNEYMFRLVVNKKYVSEKLLRDFDQKPVMLTSDDPLFGVDD